MDEPNIVRCESPFQESEELEDRLINKIIDKLANDPSLIPSRKKKEADCRRKIKNYYLENEEFRERVKSKAREKVQCDKCGNCVSRANISKHRKSKLCLNRQDKIQERVEQSPTLKPKIVRQESDNSILGRRLLHRTKSDSDFLYKL